MILLANWMKSQGKKLVVSTDDLIIGHLIPEGIESRKAYLDPQTTRNIHDLMSLADRIVTTQPFLASQLSGFYEQPISKFVCLPNLPPFNWLGRYAKPRRVNVKEFRVGMVSSLSHFDREKKGGDDFQLFLDGINAIPDKVKDKIVFVLPVNEDDSITSRIRSITKKVEVRGQVTIRDYPMSLAKMSLDLIVAPLLDNPFNKSKSNIKVLEAAAMQTPIFASDIYPYKGFMDERHMFKDA